MTEPRLRLEASGNEIVVTLPRTSLEVTYQKCVEGARSRRKIFIFLALGRSRRTYLAGGLPSSCLAGSQRQGEELGWIG